MPRLPRGLAGPWVQDEIRSLFYPSLPGLPFPLPGPFPLLRLVLSLLERSRPPRFPVGSWYCQGQVRESRRWRQAAQAADVRDVRLGQTGLGLGASNLGFSCTVSQSSVCPSSQGRADRGGKYWGPQSLASPRPGEHHSISMSVTF